MSSSLLIRRANHGISFRDRFTGELRPLDFQAEAQGWCSFVLIFVCLFFVIARVFERIVYDQLYNFLTNEDIISNHQSGFRSLHSTVTARLLEATDNWAFNIDRGNVNAVVFLDLKKAFDTVDHDILLSKMNLYGIQGTALDWFKSYLTNRTQRCLVNGSLSRVCSLKCGVPQGTILGPLLFLIYINDLPNCLTSCQPRMYADDTVPHHLCWR